jgi:hypothetical protein
MKPEGSLPYSQEPSTQHTNKKLKLSSDIIKHHTIKRHMGMEIWLHHSCPRHWKLLSGQLHAATALTLAKEILIPIE